MLCCPSFTRSVRFLQADQLSTRLRRVEYTATCRSHDKLHVHVNGKRVRERDGVRCTILVGSDLPHSLVDVRQNAASVKDPVLDDEQLEESLIS